MQTRSFRGSGEPAWVIASSNACERLGPDPRRALGPAAIRAASTGRTHDRTRPMLHQRKKLLSIRRRPHMTRRGHRWPTTAMTHNTSQTTMCMDTAPPRWTETTFGLRLQWGIVRRCVEGLYPTRPLSDNVLLCLV